MKRFKQIIRFIPVIIIWAVSISSIFTVPNRVYAQAAPTPTPVVWTSTEWVPDERVTIVGKRAERARQFIRWVLESPSIDNHPVFRQIWLVSAGTSFFLILVVVAFMGLGILLARKRDISFNIDIIPVIYKTALLLLYVAFSYLIVLALIQLTDIIMEFFIKTLAGDSLFKIFFTAGANSEQGYREFQGFKRVGLQYEESVRTSLFLIDFTSFTYFAMGIMILLRKIVLWFLLVVSPFLAILMPFVFIRNIGWIWIGVFFQWAFYGPLFALFLGALSRIWTAGIPFLFDFERTINSCEPAAFRPDPATAGSCQANTEIVYPLAINILYGGPAQSVNGLGHVLLGNQNGFPVNSSNYIDTFAEYVIALIMLWVVIILPWWLLRIFRDYCCDGIYAMRNILLNMMNGGKGPLPSPSSSPGKTARTAVQQPSSAQINKERSTTAQNEVVSRIAQISNIKKVKTEELAKQLEVHVSSLKDVAQFEVQHAKRDYYNRLSEQMRNPMSAENPADRALFVKLKTEVSNRAVHGDKLAQRILEATTAGRMQISKRIQSLAQSRPSMTNTISAISKAVTAPINQTSSILETWSLAIAQSSKDLQSIAESVQSTQESVARVVSQMPKTAAKSNVKDYVAKVADAAGVDSKTVREIIKSSVEVAQSQSMIEKISQQSKSDTSIVKKVLSRMHEAVSEKVHEQASIASGISQKLELPINRIKEIVADVAGQISTNTHILDRVAQSSSATSAQVKAIASSLPNALSQDTRNIAESIAQQNNMPVKTVEGVLNSFSEIASEKSSQSNVLSSVAQKQGIKYAQAEAAAEVFSRLDSLLNTNESIIHVIESKAKITSQRAVLAIEGLSGAIASNSALINEIAKRNSVSEQAVKKVFSVLSGSALSGSASSVVDTIASQANIDKSAVGNIIKIGFESISKQGSANIYSSVAQKQGVSQGAVKTIFDQLAKQTQRTNTLVEALARQASLSTDKFRKLLESITNVVVRKQEVIQSIAKFAHKPEGAVQSVLETIPSAVQKPPDSYVSYIASQTQQKPEDINAVLDAVGNVVSHPKEKTLIEILAERLNQSIDIVEVVVSTLTSPESQASAGMRQIVDIIAKKTSMSSQQVHELIKNMINQMLGDSRLLSITAKMANVSLRDIQNILSIIPTVIEQSSENYINAVASAVRRQPSDISRVLSELNSVLHTKTENIINAISQELNVDEKTIKNIVKTATDYREIQEKAQKDAQEPVSEGIEVDDLIAEEDSLSLDEYEEIKQMWINHYLHGEVPVSNSIHSREDWVSHDSVVIENILNKIISDNEETRAKGLSEVADIIPFFVLADMSLQDVAVYLKAKRAAAKEVLQMLMRESAVKQRLEKHVDDEVFVKRFAEKNTKVHKPKAMEIQRDEEKSKISQSNLSGDEKP